MDRLSIKELSLLVIEPSLSQSKVLKERLHSLDVDKVEFVASGEEALAYMLKTLPDLVISSMYLPDTSADKLVVAMRESTRLRDVPFMLISSETSFAMLDPLRQAGIIAILPKPFETQDLKKALSATVDYITVDEDALADADIDIDNLKILVVDDSVTARLHICRVLNNLGINNISMAENGLEAAKLIAENYYDLVVTDYNMPEMDGEQLTRYIREQSNQSSIPILMVTSEGNESRLSAVQQAGVSGICDKPFDPQTVKHLIKSTLSDI